jgi:hypothetical protein
LNSNDISQDITAFFHIVMDFQALSQQVQDKNSAVAFLQQHGILHASRTCYQGHPMKLCLSNAQDRWRCRIRGCRTEEAVRTGTWLEKSKLPFETVVKFIYWWSHEQTTIAFSEHELHMATEAIVEWNDRLREVCAQDLIAIPHYIGGPGFTVEIDESLFAKRKNNVGRQLPAQWVFGGICRETRDCFLIAVPDRTQATLMPIIRQHIVPGKSQFKRRLVKPKGAPGDGRGQRPRPRRGNKKYQ